MTLFPHLPTVADVAAERQGKTLPKVEPGQSLLEQKDAAKRLTLVDEQSFRKAVIDRDGYLCRCCGCHVVKTRAAVKQRLEVNHIHGRIGELRFEDRCALVLCLWCHSRVTGRISDRLAIVPTQTFTLNTITLRGVPLTDARFPVTFERVA